MIVKRTQIITIFILIFIISLSIIPVGLAKPRKTYITDFLYDCEIHDEGFSNSAEQDDDFSEEATAYALEILDYFDLLVKKDLFGKVEKTVNTTDLTEYLEDKAMGMVDSGNPDLYDIYYLLKALDILEETNDDFSISSSLNVNTKNYLDTLLQNEGGYTPSRSSTSATIPSTYFALAIYDLIDEKFANKSITQAWIRSCQNSDGGFGGTIDLPSTILNTYYAILITELIDDVSVIPDEDNVIKYLKSFYEDNENDLNNFGGYYPEENSDNTLISSTFYCVIGIYLIDDGELKDEGDTLKWLLNHQNFKDGGFVDSREGYSQKYSSVINSYFAFQLLKILDKDQVALNEEIFMAEFNWWILIGILVGIGIIAVAIVIIRRKRRI